MGNNAESVCLSNLASDPVTVQTQQFGGQFAENSNGNISLGKAVGKVANFLQGNLEHK